MSEIDEATGLPLKDWRIGTDDENRIQAVWKTEADYAITRIGEDSWSLDEVGQSLGSFASAVEAAEAMPVLAFDPWDGIDDRDESLFLRLAPRDFDEWVSGESDEVYLRREHGSWWLSEPGRMGRSEYPTRLRGMIAGLELYEDSYAESDKLVIASLELDENDWRVEIDKGFILATYLHDEAVTLQADDGSVQWAMFRDEVLVENYPDIKAAVAAFNGRTMAV